MNRYRHLSIAIPMLQEAENISFLLEKLRKQGYQDFDVYVCVNHPDDAAEDIVRDNRRSVALLMEAKVPFPIHIIEKVWHGKQRGVGWARKVLLDEITRRCGGDELIVSLDADTGFGSYYFENLLEVFNAHPRAVALAVPYSHHVVGEEEQDRAMLRYELYMRHYLLHLMLIRSPYAFTAMGSAMVFPAWSYVRAGGITPLQGGEDFYLMQKFAKTGTILLHSQPVHPSARKSSRVPFGTGPAISKGLAFIEERYPFFPTEAFQHIGTTYSLFPTLYEHDVETPMSNFLRQQLKTDDLWTPLRRNFKRQDLFVHACHERVDGLRILQYLHTFPSHPAAFYDLFPLLGLECPASIDFAICPVNTLISLRKTLRTTEDSLRKSYKSLYGCDIYYD